MIAAEPARGCPRLRRSRRPSPATAAGAAEAPRPSRQREPPRERRSARARSASRRRPPPLRPAGRRRRSGKTFVSPVVARIASEHGVDSAQVPGTGRGGRVTKKDILAFIEWRRGAAAPPAAPARARPLPRRRRARGSRAAPAPAPRRAGPRAAGRRRAGETARADERDARGIAEHMRRSLDTSAHVTSAIEVDMSQVVAIREKLKPEYQSELRRQPDLPRLRRARDRRDAARLPVDQRRDPRRPDRHAQLRQPRLRGRARRRQGPDRPGRQERRGR